MDDHGGLQPRITLILTAATLLFITLILLATMQVRLSPAPAADPPETTPDDTSIIPEDILEKLGATHTGKDQTP